MTTVSLLDWFLRDHRAPRREDGSDVNAVGVLLAQGFVFLGEEGLTFQIRGADLTKTDTQSVVEHSHVPSSHPGGLFEPCGARLHLPRTRSRCRAR